MDNNPYRSPESRHEIDGPQILAAPLAARVAAIILFCLAGAAATYSAIVWNAFRSLPPGDKPLAGFVFGVGWVAAVVFTVLGFLVLWLTLSAVTPDR